MRTTANAKKQHKQHTAQFVFALHHRLRTISLPLLRLLLPACHLSPLRLYKVVVPNRPVHTTHCRISPHTPSHFAALLVVALLPARAVIAAETLDSVLKKLDASSANFHTTSADFEFDTVSTLPIYDEDIQTGVTYYKRDGQTFQWGAHIDHVNGKPVPKVVVLSGGSLKLYEKLANQVTTITKLSQYQSWFMLGFGAGGQELAEKWDIKYLGSEKIDSVNTEKLELVAKDANVRKNILKVTIWMDVDRGVSLKQLFDQGHGQSRTCHYTNIKVNQPVASDAFTFKTDKQTRFVTQ